MGLMITYHLLEIKVRMAKGKNNRLAPSSTLATTLVPNLNIKLTKLEPRLTSVVSKLLISRPQDPSLKRKQNLSTLMNTP